MSKFILGNYQKKLLWIFSSGAANKVRMTKAQYEKCPYEKGLKVRKENLLSKFHELLLIILMKAQTFFCVIIVEDVHFWELPEDTLVDFCFSAVNKVRMKKA